MNRSKRVVPLARLAADRERSAARTLAEVIAEQAECRRQLDSLIAYREEYERGFVDAARGGAPAARVARHRDFLRALDEAIAALATRVDALGRDGATRRRAWLTTRNRTRALDKAIGRFELTERGAVRRREQRDLDETRGLDAGPGPGGHPKS